MPAPSYWPLPPVIVPVPAQGRAPQLTAADCLAALQNLLPPGRAWAAKTDPDAVLYQLLAGIADAQARAFARQTNLLTDAFPASTVELAPEWQASLGLPDPCAGPDPSPERISAQILARFTMAGGQSIDYFTAVAASLGVTLAIAELSNGHCDETECSEPWGAPVPARPFRAFAMDSLCTEPLAEWTGGRPASDWDFVLQLTASAPYTFLWAVGDSDVTEPLTDYDAAPLTQIRDFAVGDSDVQTPLALWGDAVLECELGRILPGHTLPIFAYTA